MTTIAQRSMTFHFNDYSTSSSSTLAGAWIRITENADGTVGVNLWIEGAITGDLRGLFFDLADEALINTLSMTPLTDNVSTSLVQGNDQVTNLGNGVNMNGLLTDPTLTVTKGKLVAGAEANGYDVGIRIGEAGIGQGDDFQTFDFTLASTARALTLEDFSLVDFAVRITSVGAVGGARDDSNKILEITSQAYAARDDAYVVTENDAVSGNTLANDLSGGGTVQIIGLENPGAALTLVSEDGLAVGHLTRGTDGSFVFDANGADVDRLSAGEELVFTLSHAIENQSEATSFSTDVSEFRLTVLGANDGPVAVDDDAGDVAENAVLNGNVAGNDYDVDRLDTASFSLVEGSFTGQGALVLNADGSFSFDAQGQYDQLNEGESETLSFSYTMTDNHGASSTAQVSFRVTGIGDGGDDDDDDDHNDDDSNLVVLDNSYPTFVKDIGHAVLVFSTSSGDTNGDGYYTVKIDGYNGANDLDSSIGDILDWLLSHDQNISTSSLFLGAQLKGGSVGNADNSYDDFWANDADATYTLIDHIANNGNTIYEWASDDEVPVDVS